MRKLAFALAISVLSLSFSGTAGLTHAAVSSSISAHPIWPPL
ncbi:hypothetical protein ACFVHQ_06835 [Actinomycetes bacterium NPDC127524]|nr:hypothetical protein [Bacillus sp. OV322]SFC01266.1 hypothetical protein SAMN05443252_101444 [Bacillus sp. OV322]